MNHFFFSLNVSIFITGTLLGLVLVGLILGLKKKETHTRLLAAYFGVYSVIMLLASLLQCYQTNSLLIAHLMLGLILLLGPILLQFAYYFPNNAYPRESKLMLLFTAASTAATEAALLIWGKFDSFGWFEMESIKWLILLITVLQSITYLCILFLWVRRVLLLEQQRAKPWWRKLFFPRNRYARAIRSFFLIFSLSSVFTVSDYLQFSGLITQEQQFMIFGLVAIIIFALFLLAYTAHLPERSNMLAKLVGACLLLVLPPLIFLGIRMDQEERSNWHRNRTEEVRAYALALKTGKEPPVPPLLVYVLSRPLGPIADYTLHFSRRPELRAEELQNFDLASGRRQDFLTNKLGIEPALPTWETPLFIMHQRVSDIDALSLRDHLIHYDFHFEGRRYELGYSYLDLRRSLNVMSLRLTLVQVVTFVMVLLFYPLLLKRMLLRPLGALMDAVRQVQTGDFAVKVQVYAQDEIGFLARAFNTMMGSFLRAQARIGQEVKARMLLEAENTRKDIELEQARKLQLTMLPQMIPHLPGLDIAVFLRAATEVGGDYYDFHHTSSDELILAMGDATGHGLQAGTMVAATKSLFNALVEKHEPISFLMETSRALAAMGFENMYMALMIARINQKHVRLTSAGMPYACLYRASTGNMEHIKLQGLPLGSTIAFPYRETSLELEHGDVLLLQSDGLEERFNSAGALMGEKRVTQVFSEHTHESAAQIVAALVASGDVWGGLRPQDDDITLMVLKWRDPAIAS